MRTHRRPAVLALGLSLVAGEAGAAPPVEIVHRDVGCVVAGQHPRLEACFTPATDVGRAQVLFRADEAGPWYSVAMSPAGTCHAALLPKPKEGLGGFHYFIEVIDRSFAAAQRPETAPASAYTPRVVGRAAECDPKMITAAAGQPTGSIVVSVARDAGGKVIQAAAQAAGQPASIAGFSTEGVTIGNTTAPAGGAASAAGTGAAVGGIGITTLAIAGGAVAAAGLVAVAASGGDDGGDGGGAGGPVSLTGRWTGNSAQGNGLTAVQTLSGITCTGRWDLTADLSHSGSSVTGTVTSTARSFTCSVPLPDVVPSLLFGQTGSGPVTGTASGGAITLVGGEVTFTGTYTTSRMELRGTQQVEGATFNYTLVLTR